MKKNILLIVCLFSFIANECFSQKQKIEYRPVTETKIEDAFPVAVTKLMKGFNLGVAEFNYGKGLLKSTYYEYYRGISKHRGKWLLVLDKNGTLDIQITDIQWWNSSKSYWENSGEGLFSKKEQNLKAQFAEDLRTTLKNREDVKKAQDWFFTDLVINRKFFESATDLAGERWFENYLKDKEVNWEMTFVDIERAGKENDTYKYKELFTHSVEYALGAISFEENKFFITKYTNSDKNALNQKGDKASVTGYCRSLVYENDRFYIVLTDQIDSDLSGTNTLSKQKAEKSSGNASLIEHAEKLKKLKELLDLGAITEEEFSEEKARIIDAE